APRDGARRARDDPSRPRPAAADRRRHHVAHAHGREDRAPLRRPDGPRPRRVAGGGGRGPRGLAHRAARPRRRDAGALRQGARAARERPGLAGAAEPRPGAFAGAALRRLVARGAAALAGRHAVRALPARGAGARRRLGALLLRLGAARPLPRRPRRPAEGRGRAVAVRRRAGAARTRRRRGLPDGDDILVYAGEERREVARVIRTLRQQTAKREGQPNLALADYVAPAGSGVEDWVGAFAVSVHGAEERAARFRADADDYSAILLT